MLCRICSSNDAKIREYELDTVIHSFRAHVDCNGHSHYRSVSREEILESLQYYAELKNDIKSNKST